MRCLEFSGTETGGPLHNHSAGFFLQQCRCTGTESNGLPAVKPNSGICCNVMPECRRIYLIAPLINLISVRDYRRLSLRNEAAGLRSKGVWVPFCLEPLAMLTLPFPALLEDANISSMDNILILNAKARNFNTICPKHFSVTRIKQNLTSRSNQLSLFCYLSLAYMKFLM